MDSVGALSVWISIIPGTGAVTGTAVSQDIKLSSDVAMEPGVMVISQESPAGSVLVQVVEVVVPDGQVGSLIVRLPAGFGPVFVIVMFLGMPLTPVKPEFVSSKPVTLSANSLVLTAREVSGAV